MRTFPAIAASAQPYADEISIHNSDNNSDVTFTLRTDRLDSFFQYLMVNRFSAPPPTMPGISGAAHYGLDCIFFGPKPPRFPAHDILSWFRERLIADGVELLYTSVPSVPEIEDALGKWAGTVTQLLADGSERA